MTLVDFDGDYAEIIPRRIIPGQRKRQMDQGRQEREVRRYIMGKLRHQKWTLREISELYDITPERVRQILAEKR